MSTKLSRGFTLAVAVATVSAGLATTGATAQAAGSIIRVSTARTAVQDAAGTTWAADQGYAGGSLGLTSSNVGIAGTTDDALYRSEHWGMTGFRQSVTPGTYDVTLKMAEIYFNAPGQRVFSVSAEGVPVVRNLDIYAAVGKNKAYDRSFRVTVADNYLDLGFTSTVNAAKMTAISIAKVTSQNVSGGSGKPDASNTGVPAGTQLTRHDGDITVTSAGTVLDSLDIHGFVTIKAPNVRITRSIVRGGVANNNVGLVTNYTPTATNFVIEDSELVPEHPSVWLDAIKGSNYTARRIDAHGTTDIVKVHGDNVLVEDSWLHDTRYWASDPNQGGGPSHNDAVQVLGGRNIHLTGNTVDGGRNSGMQVTQDYSATTDLEFSGNWADGGWCTINLASKGLSRMVGITVSNNRFGTNTSTSDCGIIANQATTLVATGNVWDATGLPVRVRNGGA